jgi:hypothetical protein
LNGIAFSEACAELLMLQYPVSKTWANCAKDLDGFSYGSIHVEALKISRAAVDPAGIAPKSAVGCTGNSRMIQRILLSQGC